MPLTNSSNIVVPQTLARISRAKAKQFFEELANLRDEPKAVARFEARFRAFLDTDDGTNCVIQRSDSGEDGQSPEGMITWSYHHAPLLSLREELRAIWTIKDLKVKAWRIFLFRADPTMTTTFAAETGPPAPTPFQQAVMHLFQCAKTMSYCCNPGCTAPYFFAGRKSQKFCAGICALPSQRDHKLRWWRKYGDEWRKSRAQKVAPETNRPTPGQ